MSDTVAIVATLAMLACIVLTVAMLHFRSLYRETNRIEMPIICGDCGETVGSLNVNSDDLGLLFHWDNIDCDNRDPKRMRLRSPKAGE